mmetsp:Transcript_4517/g.10577  ORF Transcript_4517/g.10577 Transcript_4517/m.10577 type:complete len:171 (+) Transcript_4517:826-1338(+)
MWVALQKGCQGGKMAKGRRVSALHTCLCVTRTMNIRCIQFIALYCSNVQHASIKSHDMVLRGVACMCYSCHAALKTKCTVCALILGLSGSAGRESSVCLTCVQLTYHDSIVAVSWQADCLREGGNMSSASQSSSKPHAWRRSGTWFKICGLGSPTVELPFMPVLKPDWQT